MGFNKDNYARIKQEYDGKYRRAEDDAKLRRAEVHAVCPEIKEIDHQLASTGFSIFDASLRGEMAEIERAKKRNTQLLEQRASLLQKAGFASDYTEIRYECPACGDTGTVDYKMCKCMIKKLVEAGLESSGMKDLIATQTFDSFDLSYYKGDALNRMKTILSIVKDYADTYKAGTSGNILMMGNTGLGKTHLSSAMGGVIIEKGNDVYYTTATGMFSDFELNRFGNSANAEVTGETEKYYTCDLLIIDDLGTEVINQFTTSCLYNVINSRLNRKKSTVINTNFNRDEMRKKYQDRITSRIFGEYMVLPFAGTDIREMKLMKK
ncbi:MAG: ATP-binding protein [Clostridia bacterium]|nr:ATP-binding protein [Clostridia bacterium]